MDFMKAYDALVAESVAVCRHSIDDEQHDT